MSWKKYNRKNSDKLKSGRRILVLLDNGTPVVVRWTGIFSKAWTIYLDKEDKTFLKWFKYSKIKEWLIIDEHTITHYKEIEPLDKPKKKTKKK